MFVIPFLVERICYDDACHKYYMNPKRKYITDKSDRTAGKYGYRNEQNTLPKSSA